MPPALFFWGGGGILAMYMRRQKVPSPLFPPEEETTGLGASISTLFVKPIIFHGEY